MSQSNKKDWIPWLIFIILAIIWGSSFILMKRGLEAFSFEQVAALRLTIAFACMLPIGWKYLRTIKKQNLIYMFIVGVFGNGFPAFLFTLAETEVSSSIVGVLNATVPIFTLILGVIFFHSKIKSSQIVGVTVGLIGAIWLMFPNGFIIEGAVNFKYASLVLIATFCYAISANTIKRFLQDVPSVKVTTIGLGFAGIPSSIYLFSTDFTTRIAEHPLGWSSFGYTFLLAFFGTSIGVVLFNELIKKSSAIFASSVTYAIPAIAILWGVLDNEDLLFQQILAVIIIVLGVYLVNKSQKKVKIVQQNIAKD